ncbi:nicotinamide riboside transporter PnuC [Aliidiomarina indica]|uniref:nicotinamide riboside transporter PnuC n=1 Tax=Aliidiomarina indica TaxID=2749147 RepID=UPI00189087EB|nr:nicotinamide riboside transporter PnuC [Aliidiomarina indica]
MDRLLDILEMSSPVELTAVALAIVYVVFAIRQSLWCWPAAIASASLFSWFFYHGQLYMESGLQAYYVVIAFYGYWVWRNKATNGAAPISTKPLGFHVVWIFLLIVSSIVISIHLRLHTDAVFPELDTVTTLFSLFATYLVARKVLENWLYWIVINSMYVWLFMLKEYYVTGTLAAVYVIMSIIGFYRWRRDYRQGVKSQSVLART